MSSVLNDATSTKKLNVATENASAAVQIVQSPEKFSVSTHSSQPSQLVATSAAQPSQLIATPAAQLSQLVATSAAFSAVSSFAPTMNITGCGTINITYSFNQKE